MSDQYTSSQLTRGEVYTRKQLKALFSIKDATLNNGIFRPKGTPSIWLFVTQTKTADRTQYEDKLEGDILKMQGQTLGRTDDLIISHQRRGDELVLFYRAHKSQYPGYGFEYIGTFRYVSHAGAQPTGFTLQKIGEDPIARVLETLSDELQGEHYFDVADIEDERKKVLRAIVQRRGQHPFRRSLLKAYKGSCCITGCKIEEILEAAHIYPYKGEKSNAVANGLLLRADLHTLFDLKHLSVDPKTYQVHLSAKLIGTEYQVYEGNKLLLPEQAENMPSMSSLASHFSEFIAQHTGLSVSTPVK